MDGHLITVEVGVKALTDEWVELNSRAINHHHFESLNTHAMQSRCTVKHDDATFDHVIKDFPDFFVAALKFTLSSLDRFGITALFEGANDERLEQLKNDTLRQAALVQLEARTNHDDRTSRVVHTLAEQVFAETTLLALDHVGKRLERAIA